MGSERKEMRTLKFWVETTQSEELVYLNQDGRDWVQQIGRGERIQF